MTQTKWLFSCSRRCSVSVSSISTANANSPTKNSILDQIRRIFIEVYACQPVKCGPHLPPPLSLLYPQVCSWMKVCDEDGVIEVITTPSAGGPTVPDLLSLFSRGYHMLSWGPLPTGPRLSFNQPRRRVRSRPWHRSAKCRV